MINSLRLQNFRSYLDDSFEFENGVNIVVGPNASGKTNLLEALLMICRGSSYRTKNHEVVRFNQPWMKLYAQNDSNIIRKVVYKHQPDSNLTQKIITVNGKDYKRLPFDKMLPVVLFEPEHLQLLRGKPELRREFIDNLLQQTTTGFDRIKREYVRTLQQRNMLLKKRSDSQQNQMFVWNIRLSELGGQIAQARQKLIDNINLDISDLYQSLSHTKKHTVKARYQTVMSTNYSSSLLKLLEDNLQTDMARGFTGFGPHRDDWYLMLNGHSAQQIASRGEVRTILLALKILELKLIENITGKRPILLLDDVFSELDGARRRALTGFLKDYQTFITTTDADIVVQHFLNNCTVIPTTKTP